MNYTILPFSRIKHLLPADSWVYTYNERNHGEFEDNPVVFFQGNTRLENLNLDRPFDEEHVFLVLVDGNLAVDTYVYNEEISGATCLIVKGDLYAQNMVVGGQEIYVTGNLEVTELFWGEYNHGDLTVAGNASASLFMDTEEYHVSVRGEQQFSLRISNWDELGDWNDLDEDLLKGVFVQDCVMELGEEPTLDREKLLEYFKAGRSVLIPDKIKPAEEPDIPFPFDNSEISVGNLIRLADSVLMPFEAKESGGKYEFWRDDEFYRVIRSSSEAEYRAVYLQEDRCAVIVETKEDERNGIPYVSLHYRGRYIEGEDTEWHPFDATSPEPFRLLVQRGWPALLAAVSRFEYYRSYVRPEQISEILSLPVVEAYDDFYDEDKSGLWCGSVYAGFRQPGVVRDGEEKPPCVIVAREQGEDMEIYHFSVEKCVNGSETVKILYQASNGYEHRALPVWDEEKLQIACRLFRIAEKKLFSLNQKLLAGHIPHSAESFSIKYWKEKGYLRAER
ncbi:hypothetical protein [Paenibacillus elgii]|uniref:hypothetical protein n=1 Tax=Paenibacillus elgii TaxID=189691 RepID=UPI000FDB8477|nr:hypothetical protein [Paenibacillus elgii]NEN81862.1 hypothetical protein [Paenibacillus elgii]